MFYYYKIFGLIIKSELSLIAESCTTDFKPDVIVKYGFCQHLLEKPIIDSETFQVSQQQLYMSEENVGEFYVSNGNCIIIHPIDTASQEMIRLYLMGTCFGAILQQRGIVALHGSCVCKDNQALLITGDSGVGKSTMASVFLHQGWKLMSDDVTPIYVENGICYAQSTYPGQKLWQDTITRHKQTKRIVNDLYYENGQQKYQLNAQDSFIYTKLPLTNVVMLTKGTDQLYLSEVTGFAKTDLLITNIYRRYMVQDKNGKANQLKLCILLAKQVHAFLAERPLFKNTEQEIYDFLESKISL